MVHGKSVGDNCGMRGFLMSCLLMEAQEWKLKAQISVKEFDGMG